LERINIYIYYLSHPTHNVKSPSMPFLLCGRKWKGNLTLQPSIPLARKKKTKKIRREGFLPFPSFHKWTWNHKSETNSHTRNSHTQKKAERQDFIGHGLILAYHDSEKSATPHSKLTDIFGLDPFYMDVQIKQLDTFLLNSWHS
jgi:hypothetical protein